MPDDQGRFRGMAVPSTAPWPPVRHHSPARAPAEEGREHDSQPEYGRGGAIIARQKGSCGLCSDPVWSGEEILRHGDAWCHVVCVERSTSGVGWPE